MWTSQREEGEPLLGHGAVASTDHVTLLFSHRYLQEAADSEARRAQRRQSPFAVLMVELTALSEINRREGYAAGDRALHEVSRALNQALAGIGATAGRFSGRRLAVVLPDTGHSDAAGLAAEVTGSLDGMGPAVRTGVAVWQQGDHVVDVLARACLALESGA